MGQSEGMPVGRYVTPLGKAGKVSLVSETLDQADPKPELWLDHGFLNIDNVKSVSLAGPK